MAKRPTLTILSAGYYSTTLLNANFTAIQTHFDNFLSRTPDDPNTMLDDLDMNSNDILNAGEIQATSLNLSGINVVDVVGQTSYAQDLNGLTLVNGDILYYDGAQLNRLAIGSNGQVLKVSGGNLSWGTDDNDDTDTVGVTVQEDSSTVATTVSIINFNSGGSNIVSVDGSNNVTVDLTGL
jgi:hypothetical protein